MIIRSGLIRNRDDVSFEAFDRHWLDVHGPLARAVPLLRAYTQNHVRARHVTSTSSAFHRTDGISQLWFDDVAAMTQAMASPEQEACVVDIKGFLDEVTIVVQRPGTWAHFGTRDPQSLKVMAVLANHLGISADYTATLHERFARLVIAGGSLRINCVVDGSYIVDRGVSHGPEIVRGIAEFRFNGDEQVSDSLINQLVADHNGGVECLAAVTVEEFQILAPHANGSDGY